jgi:hypothetical protein
VPVLQRNLHPFILYLEDGSSRFLQSWYPYIKSHSNTSKNTVTLILTATRPWSIAKDYDDGMLLSLFDIIILL